ncbi:type III secretion system translocon protein SseD [Yersinia pekkanenii]|uniref:Methyl-accepting chemotaxis protein n=1 Tax=Yersinia pekkanenii TaxID=1288385 RepID=A0A0T9QRF0_9GAMM|nr:chemotaxis protein [Yersinia pekkanenii]CNI24819.1 methyl-accepting chemotaxis protein [Yersinia pekkanenii]CRY68899.1 methyl-accepting chemotaxis protein [Yersinia pekkanenii]
MNIPINQEIKVNEQVPQSVDNGGRVDNNIGNIISNISDVIFQMSELFKKMRDLLNTYNQKQQTLGWDIQVSSMKNKRDAIAKVADGAIASGVCAIISGVVSGVGAGVGLKFGEIGGQGGKAIGELISGSGRLAEGDMAQDAELSRMLSDLQGSGAQSYNKSITELENKIHEARQSMNDINNTLLNLNNQIAMASKF